MLVLCLRQCGDEIVKLVMTHMHLYLFLSRSYNVKFGMVKMKLKEHPTIQQSKQYILQNIYNTYPAILLRSFLLGMMAISSHTLLLTWKSRVSLV